MKGLFKNYHREDLPNKALMELSDVIGMSQMKAVLVKCPGMTFHVPKVLYRKSDMDFIRKNPDMKKDAIADALGCSLRTVYRKQLLVK